MLQGAIHRLNIIWRYTIDVDKLACWSKICIFAQITRTISHHHIHSTLYLHPSVNPLQSVFFLANVSWYSNWLYNTIKRTICHPRVNFETICLTFAAVFMPPLLKICLMLFRKCQSKWPIVLYILENSSSFVDVCYLIILLMF